MPRLPFHVRKYQTYHHRMDALQGLLNFGNRGPELLGRLLDCAPTELVLELRRISLSQGFDRLLNAYLHLGFGTRPWAQVVHDLFDDLCAIARGSVRGSRLVCHVALRVVRSLRHNLGTVENQREHVVGNGSETRHEKGGTRG